MEDEQFSLFCFTKVKPAILTPYMYGHPMANKILTKRILPERPFVKFAHRRSFVLAPNLSILYSAPPFFRTAPQLTEHLEEAKQFMNSRVKVLDKGLH